MEAYSARLFALAQIRAASASVAGRTVSGSASSYVYSFTLSPLKSEITGFAGAQAAIPKSATGTMYLNMLSP